MLRSEKIVSWLVSLALVLGVMVMPIGFSCASEAQTLTIVHVNDVHGRLAESEWDGALGFAKLKTKVDQLREEDPNLLLLNAGDTFHGTTEVNVTRGETIVEAMNIMGFDAMVPGNHDFNYGYKRLLELKKMAEFPLVAANIVKEKDKSTDFESYQIFTMDNGLRVGVFGLATDETKYKTHPDNTKGIEFIDAVKAGKKAVKELEAEKIHLVIALVHLGVEASSINTSIKIAEEVEGIDIIVDGHSHTELPEGKLVNGALIVQTGSYTKNVGIVKLNFEDKVLKAAKAQLVPYSEVKDLEEDEEILEIIAQMESLNAPIVNAVVGKTSVDLDGLYENVRTKETNLGNLVADAMRESTGADIAFVNGGAIRESIPTGDIIVNQILKCLPFTNTLAVIEITGAELKKALEHGVKDFPTTAGHFPQVSGIKYTFNPSKPAGERTTSITVGAESVDINKTYKLVTNDFIAAGGDGYIMFKNKPFVGEGGLISESLIEHVEKVGTVNPSVEGRITIINTPGSQPKPETSKKYKEYIVKPGDWLSKIGITFGVDWNVLADYNLLKNPNLIFPNQTIKIPQ